MTGYMSGGWGRGTGGEAGVEKEPTNQPTKAGQLRSSTGAGLTRSGLPHGSGVPSGGDCAGGSYSEI